ncbi:MAG: M28 family peptidase, partial [Caldilineaceae bacterium]
LPIEAVLNMDIIGSSTGPDGQIVDDRMRLYSVEPNNSPSRELAREINLIGSRLNPTMAIELQGAGDREGRYSDHLSFSDVGFPAVRFIEYLENPTRQHNDSDSIDAVRPSYLVKTTQTVLAVATALADGPRAPRSISLREAGDGNRTLVWETTPDAVSYVVALRAPGSIAYNYYFDVPGNSVTWDGFIASRWEAIAIGALDANGLMGPLSDEFYIAS